MERYLGKYSSHLYALLRLIAGLVFALHGSQRLLGFPGNRPGAALASLLGAAGVIELVCGLMIGLGLFAGYAAFVASGEMAVAYFTRHSPQGLWPTLNGGELAVLYCFLFLYVASRGSGSWSFDSARRGKR